MCRCRATEFFSRGTMQLSVLITAAFLQLTDGVMLRTSCRVIRTQLLVADCTNRSYQVVPEDLPSNIHVLLLDFNIFPNLEQQLSYTECPSPHTTTCSRFPHLLRLDIINCGAENVSGHFLHGMQSLLSLSLRKNKLQLLAQETFRDNKNLNFIDISHNRISFIPYGLFDNLISLKLLDLSSNCIQNIHHEAFMGLQNLYSLLLNNNSLTYLDSNVFGNLSNLRALNLDQNNLKQFPGDLLQNLKRLEIFLGSNNRITSLSSTFFSGLPAVKIVVLSHNLITRLSKFILQDLTGKIVVDFSFNMIEYLYLDRIPITLVYEYDHYVLNTNSKLCTNVVGAKNPCFISELSAEGNPNVFHLIDFSFNNISLVGFSNTKFVHSLEFVNLSLAGNFGAKIPVDFVKRERYMTELRLDWTDFGWKNFTLFNELFELPNLETLSIVGCNACEYYTRNVLFSVFNPKRTVNVICNEEWPRNVNTRSEIYENPTSYTRQPDVRSSSNVTLLGNWNDFPYYPDDLNDMFPCEEIDNETEVIIYFESPDVALNISCSYLVDCSYTYLSVLPHITNASCVLLSHIGITYLEENAFQSSRHLKLLDLSSNKLRHLPSGIFQNLESLYALKLDYNMLTSLESSLFMNLSRLGFLSLKGNSIGSYSYNTFTHLPSLKMLSVDFRGHVYLHDETFKSQLRLIILEINETDYNSGFAISPNSSISHLQSLKSLTLRGFTYKSSLSNMLFNLTELVEIKFERTEMPEIYDNYFARLKNLKKLELRGNKIKIISENAFIGLISMDHIDISYNDVSTLHNDVFIHAVHLKHLNMSHNKIESFDVTLFHKLISLQFLDLSYNAITKIDLQAFIVLHSLRGLGLRNNKITEIYFGCWNNKSATETHTVSSLTFTDSVKNGIPHCAVSSDADFVKNVTNQSNFQSNVWNKTNFALIDLSRNALALITSATFISSPLLLGLSLVRNNISLIENDVFKYTPLLKLLYLRHNLLSAVTKTLFKNLTNLEHLDLSHNQIEFIEEGAFKDLRALKILKLQFNRLKTFNAEWYFSDNILVTLFLNDNFITINNINFLPLTNLNIVSLHNNNLGNVSQNTFALSHSLGSLVLSNANILTIHPETFKNNTALTVFLLDRNPVHSLTPRHFYSLSGMIYLDMSRPKVVPGDDIMYAGLSWKNLTLLNFFFGLADLQYFIISHNPVCELSQYTQLIENLFLSETWRTVICAGDFTAPPWYVNSKEKSLSYNIDMVTQL